MVVLEGACWVVVLKPRGHLDGYSRMVVVVMVAVVWGGGGCGKIGGCQLEAVPGRMMAERLMVQMDPG